MRGLLALLIAAALSAGSAHAQYPDRPVKILVPFIAGSAPDVAARQVSERLMVGLRQQFLVENRPGAAGNIGAEVAARAEPNGYTLMLMTSSHLANPFLYTKVGYDPLKDFVPITIISRIPSLMVVPPSSPAKSVAEFIALAKSRPGKLNYGSGGVGSLAHLSGEAFRLAAGIDYVHVPYKGAPDILRGLLGEQIDVGFPTMGTVSAQAKQGLLRPLAVTSAKRTPVLPDVPTLKEAMASGGGAGFVQEAWFALVAPAGTPRPVVDRLYSVLKAAAADPTFVANLTRDGSEIVLNDPGEFAASLRPESAER
ncbi:MAG TPA: tripartite tricarboxylate transporter substrate binding protein, partial [Reyranellaceae bacterium]|nr:tripartite tricarboxylate transporter substrate binding protein [Reyranellaceae bacterium]